MTTPNNQPPSPAVPFAVTGSGSATDGSGTTAANLASRTQDAVTALLGQTQIQQSPGWTAASTSAYAGLTPGIPYSLAIIEQFVSQVTGLPIGSWSTVNEALLALEGIASNKDLQQNFTTIFEDLGLPTATASSFASWLQTVLTPNSSLNASNLWGLLPTSVGVEVSATSVTSAPAQPLWNPYFEGAISFAPGAGWTWDSTCYYQWPSYSYTGTPGSALVTADGGVHAFKSNPIPVSAGQQLAITMPVLAVGLECTGQPIELTAILYLNNTQVAIQSLTSMGVPTGATTGWVDPPSGAVAGQLTDTLTIPNDGSVNRVVLRPVLDSTATGGTVRYGGASVSISGGLIATLQNGLTTLQNDSTASNAANSTFLQAILTAIANNPGNWIAVFAAVAPAYNTWVTTQTGLATNEFATLGQMLNSLFNLNTTTGLFSATSIANVLGGSNLGADVASVNSTANNGIAWLTRVVNDLRITSDVFHLTYQVGTSTDAPGTLGTNGKPTWYSAWNDLLELSGVVNDTTAPTDAAPTTGTVIQANTAAATTAGTNASMAIASATNATNLAQGTIDGIYQSQNGGSSTGNAVSTVVPSLTAIPASNVIGIAPNTVNFGASGSSITAYNNGTFYSNPYTTTEQHTPGADDTMVTVAVAFMSGQQANSGSITSVKFGSTLMSPQGPGVWTTAYGNRTAFVQFYNLKIPAGSSAQTVTAVIACGGLAAVAIQSVSYNAATVGTPVSVTGSGTAFSHTGIASATGHRVVQAFVTIQNGSSTAAGAVSAYSQSQRYNFSDSTGTYNFGLVLGDAPGASTVAFTATDAQSVYWASYAMDISN
jgi:hypothetical protein